MLSYRWFRLYLPSRSDWKQQEIVVKAVRAGYYAAEYTQIQVGDVLLSVNGVKASGQNFDKIMHLLKRSNRTLIAEGQSNGSGQMGEMVNAEFMSSEEKLSMIRQDALIQKSERKLVEDVQVQPDDGGSKELAIKVSIRIESATIFITTRLVDPETPPEYLIMNRSPSHSLVYKQRGLRGNKWLKVMPGEAKAYYWENPFKQRVLLLQLSKNILLEQDAALLSNDLQQESRSSKQALARVERASVSIEIGMCVRANALFLTLL